MIVVHWVKYSISYAHMSWTHTDRQLDIIGERETKDGFLKTLNIGLSFKDWIKINQR